MTDLSITTTDVALLTTQASEVRSGPAAEAITAGDYVRLDPTTGKWAVGNATTSGELGNVCGMAMQNAAAGFEVDVALPGALMDLGDALDALDYDDAVYVSDTDGVLADAAGTTSRVFGYVAPLWAHTTADKVLRVDPQRMT